MKMSWNFSRSFLQMFILIYPLFTVPTYTPSGGMIALQYRLYYWKLYLHVPAGCPTILHKVLSGLLLPTVSLSSSFRR